MSILVDSNTKVICQGLTGRQATYHARIALDRGTQLVGGVSPGKGGTEHLGLPVFNTVSEAVSATGADASTVFVPPAFAGRAMTEAIEAELDTVVCVTERVPILDMVRVRAALNHHPTTLIGPNCVGIITPGECLMGVMPSEVFVPGRIGIISRASTMLYEVAQQLTDADLGQSSAIGIGGDPIHGFSFVDALRCFAEDDATDAIVMVGEIGGEAEIAAADFINSSSVLGRSKPVVAWIGGQSAPEGRRMGHAGAIQRRGGASVADKKKALLAAGAVISESPMQIGQTVAEALTENV